MRQKDPVKAAELERKLTSYTTRALPGIADLPRRQCLINQIIDSVRRIQYVKTIETRDRTTFCINPSNRAFDPLNAAVWHRDNGDLDEALWLVFLITHFGKHKTKKWELVRNVYGKLGARSYWNWRNVCRNKAGFIRWLQANQTALKSVGGFGNHRKYQSLDALKRQGTGQTILSYINWIGRGHSHAIKIVQLTAMYGSNRRELFAGIYDSMNAVMGFGRTAKFDFLTMAGKLDLFNVEPGSTFMVGATGPYSGAKMLFGSNETRKTCDAWLADLEAHLGMYYGMQVLEDSLCNWQKSPRTYKYFSG